MSVHEPSTLEQGVVCKRTASACQVRLGEKTISCSVSVPGKEFPASHNPVTGERRSGPSGGGHPAPLGIAVGDHVMVQRSGPGPARIVEILPRRNRISRRAAGCSRANPVEQILAANISRILVLCAVDHHPPEWHLLDRFLALAESAGIPAIILLSKSDLLPGSGHGLEEIHGEILEYRRIGYTLIQCSSKTGLGLEAVRTILRQQTSIVLGKSGAGKSALLNAIYPDWKLRSSEVSRFGEGRCTTSNAELHPLECGGAVVDTPGLRTLALWESDGLDSACHFREMRGLVGRCRFGSDCRHREEPGCAIRRAVEAGQVSPRRFRSMLRLAGETS